MQEEHEELDEELELDIWDLADREYERVRDERLQLMDDLRRMANEE